MMAFYPAARHRPHRSIHDPAVRPLRLAVIKAATINLLILQLLFLGLFCYLFGSIFQQTTHIHNLNILFVDYDGGPIGQAIRAAYQQLQGPGFPTLQEQSPDRYPQPTSIISSVCHIHHWGGLYTSPNASNRLSAALADPATTYNRSDILTLVWNEARYPSVIDSAIQSPMQSLSNAARIAYTQSNGLQILQTMNQTDPAAISLLANPWSLSSINLQPTTQGSRLIYNTLVVILILIQEFFYLGYLNGLYQQFHLYVAVDAHRIAIVRQLLSVTYTFIGSLCTTGAIWAFRYDWHVSGGQYMLTWMTLWLFAHLNFLVLDMFTIWLPPPVVPMALISWVVLNVTSILLPFELSPGFYRWGHALPAHSVFQVMVDIWSGGCNPQLDYALPVLFAYEVVGLVVSTVGVYRRAHYAVLAEEKQAEDAEVPETPETAGEASGVQRQETETEGVSGIQQEMSRLDRIRTSRQSMGPAFDLPYTD
ncbi:SNG1 family protein [Aspergillus ibericus CBS 121593]|uniref:Nitrosoguanidine resistance protein SNG1 n=1 Tax=Aspergillus ibericus CBS 121593 TaxID=1448316 RepID=A0A395HDE6_9EURO|nr:nitrosoguanidine resistance protein SNG1 [Aspergillus ibericus CBS 121593]RAL04254.1 nitrosoguanidine resistance protein SNG1 [Aspergillus ibericus CBS 121593]